jgi:hypothetical protein
MQAAMIEPVAVPVTGSGLSCDDLANKIKVSVSKGDQYHQTAGILLLEAKRRLPEFGLTWPAFLVGKCQLQKSRSAELIAIAEGRTTVAEVQAKGRERAARHAAKNKAARSSVSNGEPPETRLSSYSGDNEWYTPSKYIELARDVMGEIDLDPASNAFAQRTVKAGTFYTIETNGLERDWFGRVWMNPPYTNPEIQQFTAKLVSSYSAKQVSEAIVLTNNSGDTAWHHNLGKESSAMCVPLGRIKFESQTRESNSPAMGQSFFYFGKT